ncbi:DUF6493 family protein [Pleionea litopenaei]|uniref:DUF6493 family protein n=1 Tax=Pleionea litopenaei TaxID=3070815 RepID=A0AA51RT16_9GAMM|nr:DUF6493 family protein [Pleionea sp. HL-JVS1]WMS87047.1 DUF6493 family protein [Pleionea sp. HL-JVS1]
MSPEQLEQLIFEAKKPIELVRLLSDLSEKDRKALSTHCANLYKQIKKGEADKEASSLVVKHLDNAESYWQSQAFKHVQLAILGLCPLSVVKRTIEYLDWGFKDFAYQVIVDRKPEWIDDWLDFELSKEFTSLDFKIIREWMASGVCKKPKVDGYVLKFVTALKSFGYGEDKEQYIPISRRLVDEPDLQEDIWRLFDIETDAFATVNWYGDNRPDNYETFNEALVKLSHDGVISRDRLLSESLAALSKDFSQLTCSGFHKFHEALAPTKDERASRQGEYINLLFHPIGHVVKFALRNIGKMQREKTLNTDLFLESVSAVFSHDAKGIAMDGLKCLERALKDKPELKEVTLNTISDALKHSHSDVQAKAIELLKQNKSDISDDLKRELENAVSFVTDANKPLLGEILDISQVGSSDNDVYDDQTLEDTRNKLKTLSANHRNLLGIDDELSLQFTENRVLHFNSIDATLRNTQLPDVVSSIDNESDLLDLLAHSIEVVDQAVDFDRILDAISRIIPERNEAFKARTAPLIKRIEDGGHLDSMKGLFSNSGLLLHEVTDLVMTWLTGKLYETPPNRYSKGNLYFIPIINMVRAIKHRVYQQKSQPLLSFPTHLGGWIDPVVWVRRLHSARSSQVSFERVDFCLSLLRLLPFNRDKALESIGELASPLDRIVKFALGEEVTLNYDDRLDYDLWISAARSRDPLYDWSSYFELFNIDDHSPNGFKPATFQWQLIQTESHGQNISDCQIRTLVDQVTVYSNLEETDHSSKADSSLKSMVAFGKKLFSGAKKQLTGLSIEHSKVPSIAFSSVQKNKYVWTSELTSAWITQWAMTLWPRNPDGFYTYAAMRLVQRIDDNSSVFDPNFAFFESLFDGIRPWSELAHLVLVFGLIGKDSDSKSLAIDALIEGIDNDLVSTQSISLILEQLNTIGFIKLNRLADSLKVVAEVSNEHRYIISQVLQEVLKTVDSKQRNLQVLFALLLDINTALDIKVIKELEPLLTSYKGKSKVAEAAKRLMGISGANNSGIVKARASIVERRLARLKET